MAVTHKPIFGQTPNIGRARLTAANTARDGSGTTPTCFTAGANGSRIESVTFTSAQATPAASSAMVARVFISDNAGANGRLLREVAIATVTSSNTVIGAVGEITFPGGLIVPAGTLLFCAISIYAGVQDQMDVVTRGIDY